MLFFKCIFPIFRVCQIQIISESLEDYLGRKLYLSEVKNIKFLSVLDPVKTINFEVVFQKLTIDEDKLKATVLLQHADKQFAKISLIYVYMPI